MVHNIVASEVIGDMHELHVWFGDDVRTLGGWMPNLFELACMCLRWSRLLYLAALEELLLCYRSLSNHRNRCLVSYVA